MSIESAPNFLAQVIDDFKLQCKFKNSRSWLFLGKKDLMEYDKMERHFGHNLEKEINKELTKDEEFQRNAKERTMDLLGNRLNLKKYLNRMAGRTEKFLKNLRKVKDQLDKKNLLVEDLKKRKIKKLEKLEEIHKKVS